MARAKVSYTKEELHHASKEVMKSLNRINTKATKSSTRALAKKPTLISNSLGRSSMGISKSSKRRKNRKEKANLAGADMEGLLSTLPVKQPEQNDSSSVANNIPELNPHKSRKSQRKVELSEIKKFKENAGRKTLEDIRRELLERK